MSGACNAYDYEITSCLRVTVARLRGQLAENERDMKFITVALSMVSGALADTGTIPVGPAVEFGDGVRALTKERDAARAALADIKSRLRKELEYRERSETGLRNALAEKDAELREVLKWCHSGHGCFPLKSCGLCAPIDRALSGGPRAAPPVNANCEHGKPANWCCGKPAQSTTKEGV